MKKKLLIRLAFALVVLALAAYLFDVYTYDHPVIVAGRSLYTGREEQILAYGRTLMFSYIGGRAHAQFITLRVNQSSGCIEILLISVMPPARTKVYHSDADVPYWETGLKSY